jgi:uncharacterized protein (TIGR02145 family)
MKKILTILFTLLLGVTLSATTYYVAPTTATPVGNDANAGTILAPWLTWQKAFATANAGDTVYFRGGVYYSTNTNTIDPEQQGYLGGPVGHSGTATNPIVYMSYPGEWAILDCSQHCETIPLGEYYNPINDIYNTAIYVAHVRNITFKDFEVRNVFQCDSVLTGAITSFFSCYMTFDHIVLHNVSERGFQVESGAYKTWYDEGWTPGIAEPYWNFDIDTIRFINCDVYDLCDSLSETIGNGADAFHTSMYPENVYIWEGCRLWNYSDDGLNLDGGGGGLRKINNTWLMPGNKYYFSGNGWTTERNGFKTGWNSSNDGWETLLWPKPTDHNTIEVSNSLVLFAQHGFREGPSNIGYWHNNTSYACAVGFYSSQDCSSAYPRPSYKNNLVYKSTENWGGIPGWPYMTLLRGDSYDESHNTWDYATNSAGFVVTDSVTVTDADFIGLEGDDTADSLYLVSLFTAPRQADGSLPAVKPLTLAPTSDLIDAGTRYISVGTQNVNLILAAADYDGVGPDIGYAGPGEQIIADHSIVDRFDDIPQYYIDEVKKMFVSIPGQSHSEAYKTGTLLLEQSYPTYAVSVVWTGTPEPYTTSNLRLSGATWGDRDQATGWLYDTYPWDLGGGEPYAWTYDPTTVTRVEAGLSYAHANGLTISAFGYGYCYNDGYYLSNVTAFQRLMDYCSTNSLPTKIFFTTGPVDSYMADATEAAYNSSQRWVYIRNHVAADETRILLDYADILSYNDAGVQQTQIWNGNTFPVIHPDNMLGGSGGWATGHIGGNGDLRLGKALWWMLARIAGWDGVSTGQTTINDIDGNDYNIVTVGLQTWIATNLVTTKFNNGSSISNVTSNSSWTALTTPAYSWYNNNITNKATYGALYNWYAVNAGNLCPMGWHIPTDAEFKTLEVYRGMTSGQSNATQWRGTTEGTELKDENFWLLGGAGSNDGGVSVRPSGFRFSQDGGFYNVGHTGYFWTATQLNATSAYVRRFDYDKPTVYRDGNLKTGGKSVRCIKD